MNTTTQFFQDKDQYKAFRKAFAAAQNDKRAHKSFTTDHPYFDDKPEEKKAMRRKVNGWLCSTHYLVFNLVSGRNYYNGFTPKTKKVFIENRGDADRGLNNAITHLVSIIEDANTILDNKPIHAPSWIRNKKEYVAEQTQQCQNRINVFLEPLNGALTVHDLARIQLPSFPGLTTEQVKQYTGKRVSYHELFGDQVVDRTPDEQDQSASPNGSSVQENARLIAEESIPTSVSTTNVVAKKKGLLTRLFGG